MKKIGLALVILLSFTIILSVSGCSKGSQNGNCDVYQIDCTLNGNLLEGKERVNYYNDSDTVIDQVKFNLFANAFRKDAKFSPISPAYTSNAYPNGISYGQIEILNVEVLGQKADHQITGEDKNILTVPLTAEIYPDECVEIVIDYKLTLADVIARTGINDKTINLANFYPIVCARDENGFYECVYYSAGDPYYSNCANYSVSLTHNSNLVVASTGKVTGSITKGDKTTTTFSIQKARSFCLVLSNEFESVCTEYNGVTINYYFYNDLTPATNLEYAKKSFELFSKKFGDYPYSTYSVCQTKFVQGGMEFPGLVMISDDLEPKAYGEVIVHETAHQWWQTAVGNNEIEYGFLDEGLAEYSVVLFYEEYPEYNLTRKALIDSASLTYSTFCSVYDKLFGNVDTTMLRSLKEYKSEYEYVNIAYVKACLMYDYLRQTIGDDMFFKGLKRYYQSYIFKNATPVDLVGTFEKCGADTNGFFDSFFNGKVII